MKEKERGGGEKGGIKSGRIECHCNAKSLVNDFRRWNIHNLICPYSLWFISLFFLSLSGTVARWNIHPRDDDDVDPRKCATRHRFLASDSNGILGDVSTRAVYCEARFLSNLPIILLNFQSNVFLRSRVDPADIRAILPLHDISPIRDSLSYL